MLDQFPYYRLYARETPQQQMNRLIAYEPPLVEKQFDIAGVTLTASIREWLLSGRFWLQTSSPAWEEFDGLSDFYLEEQRMRARKFRQPQSPHELWRESGERLALTRAGIEEQRVRIYNTFDEVGQFRLAWAKAVFTVLASLATAPITKVLDPCAGWGDRLLTAISLGYEYCGYDPNFNLRAGHDRMIHELGNAQRHRVIYMPAEEVTVTDEPPTVDIVFTSPPFFGLEHYSDDAAQASVRYRTFDEWYTRFLVPMLAAALAQLRPDGLFALHIVDSRHASVVDRVHSHLTANAAFSYVGVVGLCGGARNWPVWVYRKASATTTEH